MTEITYDLDPDFIVKINDVEYYLGPEASHKMNWEDAITWCKSLGDNYELPNRLVLLACYEDVTIRNKFKTSNWYWSSTEFSTTTAWGQYFANGNKSYDGKGNNYFVRAVRKVAID